MHEYSGETWTKKVRVTKLYFFIYKLFFLIKKSFYFLLSFSLLKINARDSRIEQNMTIIYMKVKHKAYHQQ